uniref:Coiled-coil domain-containing protein 12 n=1 Tax=Quercus lobata TaxID=97700 RepID=A0A7N2MPJ6_QUELO
MAAEEDSIEQAAAARRERLRTLKAAQELLNTPDEDSAQVEHKTNDENGTNEENNFNMKFRNYVPHDKQLQEGKVSPPVLPKFEDPIAAAPLPSAEEDPFVNIAPKKPNWDLRRDVQKKLDKLERRTQKALYKLMVSRPSQTSSSASPSPTPQFDQTLDLPQKYSSAACKSKVVGEVVVSRSSGCLQEQEKQKQLTEEDGGTGAED